MYDERRLDDGQAAFDAAVAEHGNESTVLRLTVRFYGGWFFVFMILFSFLRKRFPRLYNIRSWVPHLKTHLADDQFGYLSWIWKVHFISDKDMLEECGMDALCFARILQMGVKLSAFALIPSFWLMPVYKTARKDEDLHDPVVELNLTNVPLPEDSRRLVATVFAGYFIFGYTMYSILQEFEWFANIRKEFLAKTRARNYTVYIQGIPEEYRNNAALREFFSQNFAEGSVLDVRNAVKINNLKKKIGQRSEVLLKLEHAINKEVITGETPTKKKAVIVGEEVSLIDTLSEKLREFNVEVRDMIEDIEEKINEVKTPPDIIIEEEEDEENKEQETAPTPKDVKEKPSTLPGKDDGSDGSSTGLSPTPQLKTSGFNKSMMYNFTAGPPLGDSDSDDESFEEPLKSNDDKRGIFQRKSSKGSNNSFSSNNSTDSKPSSFGDGVGRIKDVAKTAKSKASNAASAVKTKATKGIKDVTSTALSDVKDLAALGAMGAKGLHATATQGVLGVASTATKGVQDVTATARGLILGEEDGAPYGAAFVSFKSLRATQAALQMIQNSVPFVMQILEAPDPEDILWMNFGKTHKELQIGKLLSIAATTALCIFWTIPMTAINALSSVEGLRKYEFIANMLEAQPWLEDALAQVAPLMIILMHEILKSILEVFSMFEQPISGSTVQASLFSKLAAFMLIQTFFISTITGTITDELGEIATNPGKTVKLLAENLPQRSTFFTQITLIKTFIGLVSELIRAFPLGNAAVRRLLGKQLSHKERNLTLYGFIRPLSNPMTFYHAHYLAYVFLDFVVFFVYSTMAPISNIFLLVCFIIRGSAYRHQWIYNYPTHPDSGGQLWVSFMGLLPMSMIVGQVTLIGVMALNRSLAFGLMIPLLAMTVLFNIYIRQQHFNVIRHLPARDCYLTDMKNNPKGKEMDYSFVEGKYIQPELRDKEVFPETLIEERAAEESERKPDTIRKNSFRRLPTRQKKILSKANSGSDSTGDVENQAHRDALTDSDRVLLGVNGTEGSSS